MFSTLYIYKTNTNYGHLGIFVLKNKIIIVCVK